MPGAVLDLLKLTVQRVRRARGDTRSRRDDLLATLSQLTGMPPLVLDDRERVELARSAPLLHARVIGQDEAVDAVVDRIAMLKAGLTDSGKPIARVPVRRADRHGQDRAGEDARGISLWLAGSADPARHERIPERSNRCARSSATRTGRTKPNALTDRVRKQPFSVVLLDEFEKAHAEHVGSVPAGVRRRPADRCERAHGRTSGTASSFSRRISAARSSSSRLRVRRHVAAALLAANT